MNKDNVISKIIADCLNESKPYQGDKIPTDEIFSNKNPHYPNMDTKLLSATNVYVDDETFEKNPVEDVEVKLIVPTQRFLSRENLKKVNKMKMRQNTGAYLVELNGLYYVIDWHHRIAHQIIGGQDEIKAFVYHI